VTLQVLAAIVSAPSRASTIDQPVQVIGVVCSIRSPTFIARRRDDRRRIRLGLRCGAGSAPVPGGTK